MELKCTSCDMNVISEDGFSKFMCPECGKAMIIRCKKCRNLSNIYKCPECGFEGP